MPVIVGVLYLLVLCAGNLALGRAFPDSNPLLLLAAAWLVVTAWFVLWGMIMLARMTRKIR